VQTFAALREAPMLLSLPCTVARSSYWKRASDSSLTPAPTSNCLSQCRPLCTSQRLQLATLRPAGTSSPYEAFQLPRTTVLHFALAFAPAILSAIPPPLGGHCHHPPLRAPYCPGLARPPSPLAATALALLPLRPLPRAPKTLNRPHGLARK
jgi:hypothetical protein